MKFEKFFSVIKSAPLLIALSLAAPFCSSLSISDSGGSGTDAPNALCVISESGRLRGVLLPNGTAGVYDGSYVPWNDSGYSALVRCDENGAFEFSPPGPGTYNVVASGGDSGYAAFFSGIRVRSTVGPDTFKSILKRVGSVSGSVKDSFGRAVPNVPVFIPGSPFFGGTDASGSFVIRQVPEGFFRLLTKSLIISPRGKPDDTLRADTTVAVVEGEDNAVGTLLLK
jgi:hypothetical protein